jgi:ribosomal protein S18 acetylase RimI-like enzyme
MEIREATQTDLPAIVELWKSMMDFHSNLDSFFARSRDGHRNFLEWATKEIGSENSKLFVADSGVKILGYIKIQISEYPPLFDMKKFGMISDAVVTDEYRRQGIGEALFKQSMNWFKEKGIDRVELRVANVNPVAHGFWKKMGFSPYMTTMFKER